MKKISDKTWTIITLSWVALLLLIIAIVTIVVDPYFHYHAPIEGISYRLYEERYINDGITRNFEYDAIITGTSMTQNFKTSEFDELFEVSSIKLPLAGGTYRELSEQIERALSRNSEVKTVLWGIDGSYLFLPVDEMKDEEELYPQYLYDDNILNDVSYLFNKDIIYHGTLNNIIQTLQGTEPTTFDEYSSWEFSTGEMAVLGNSEIIEIMPEQANITKKQEDSAKANVEENFLKLINQYPEVDFKLFITPYSIVYWHNMMGNGTGLSKLDGLEILANGFLDSPNVEFYSFYHNYDLVCNLDNYKDVDHYSAEINSDILEMIKAKEYLITEENIEAIFDDMREFYLNYDYTKLRTSE